MFRFTKDSAIAIIFAGKVLNGSITLEQVPTFFGLKAAVEEILKTDLGAVNAE